MPKVGLHIERYRVDDHESIMSEMDRLIPGMTDMTGKLLKTTNGVELYMQGPDRDFGSQYQGPGSLPGCMHDPLENTCTCTVNVSCILGNNLSKFSFST